MDVHVDWIRTGWIRRSPGGDDDDHDNNPMFGMRGGQLISNMQSHAG